MSFFNERCPNCGKAVNKNADYCNSCGCPSATAWASCTRCGSSVGSDSQFCWKCGHQQDLNARRRIYFDRWQRAADDFAIRVDLVLPDKALHHGLQVDDGTLALLFRNGVFQGVLEPGYHEFDTFFQRLMGADHGGQSHAILLDMQSAEVDFYLDNLTTHEGLNVDARLRCLFKVTDPKMFADRFLVGHSSFGKQDLADAFTGDVRLAVQTRVGGKTFQELLETANIRELLEDAVLSELERAFAGAGLKSDGVRLADVTGEVVDQMKEQMAEFRRVTLEREMRRRLEDATREEKVRLFKDEQDLNDYFEQVSHDLGFKSADRDQQRKVFMLEAEKQLELRGVQLDWSIRLASTDLDLELRKRQRAAEIEARKDHLEAELEENQKRFGLKQTQSVAQSESDLEVARRGIEALKLVKEAKHEAAVKEKDLELEVEKHRLELRSNASLQGLLATLSGEQADRVLKLAELEMRKGMTPEQSLAYVAEKAPDYFAPAVASALKAKFAGPQASSERED
jgi:hypothetical protein